MTQPRAAFVPIMGHEMHVSEWGNPKRPALVMWHGLARTGRDFDELAEALSDMYFVLCPDTIGRGLSSWATDPEAQYRPSYMARMAVAMLDHYGIDQVDWLGTSMGGLVGMHLASGPHAARMNGLIINDIGPELPPEAIERILTYAADLPEFATMAEAETWLRTVYAPFGPAEDRFWQRMARTSVRRRGNGRLTLHYDPRMVRMFDTAADELVNWDRFDRIAMPVHVMWGTQSDILTAPILDRMKQAACRPVIWDFPDCGHAPTLSRPEDIAMMRRILETVSEG